MDVRSIILATDQGNNMKSKKAKVLHTILGKPLISYGIGELRDMSIREVCVLVGNQDEEIKSILGNSVTYAADQATYVMETHGFIEGSRDVIILNGDMPLITSLVLKRTLDFHNKYNKEVTVLTGLADNAEDYGKVYVFKTKVLQSALEQIKTDHQQASYLEDVLEILHKGGCAIDPVDTPQISDVLRVNSRGQLAQCTRMMKERINEKHMENGVTLEDPRNTYIEPEVIIGYDTIIEPNCILKGKTVIGNDCFIGTGTNIEHSQIANHVRIENSHIHESFIDDHAHLGPFAYIRPHSRIGKNVRIGDFVEIKNSNIGDYTKVSHLTYVGDADVGEHVNFGCGSVLVNYDGINKHRSKIEDYAFIGCNTNLVSPVNIGERAFTAAGSTITNDVPEESLGISRVRQVNKEGWVAYKYPKK